MLAFCLKNRDNDLDSALQYLATLDEFCTTIDNTIAVLIEGDDGILSCPDDYVPSLRAASAHLGLITKFDSVNLSSDTAQFCKIHVSHASAQCGLEYSDRGFKHPWTTKNVKRGSRLEAIICQSRLLELTQAFHSVTSVLDYC